MITPEQREENRRKGFELSRQYADLYELTFVAVRPEDRAALNWQMGELLKQMKSLDGWDSDVHQSWVSTALVKMGRVLNLPVEVRMSQTKPHTDRLNKYASAIFTMKIQGQETLLGFHVGVREDGSASWGDDIAKEYRAEWLNTAADLLWQAWKGGVRPR